MKRQFFALGGFVLALGALATQSCEFTDGQNSYYNRGHYGYYRDGAMVITTMAVTPETIVITTNAVTPVTTTSRIALRLKCIFRTDAVH
jgi:hypothetical protein